MGKYSGDNWQASELGYKNDRYEIRLEGPSIWLLTVSNRPHSRHATVSAARREAERLERLRSGRSRLARLGSGLAVVVMLLAVVGWQRVGPSPDRRAAEAVVARLDDAYQAIASKSASIDDFTGPEVRGSLISLTDGEDLSVLVGQAGGTCYVLYWSPSRRQTARALDVSHGVPCDAGVAVGLWNLDWRQASSSWDSVLPSATEERVWFLPAVVVLAGVGLALLWRFIAALGQFVGK
jgi:hypothetical protein